MQGAKLSIALDRRAVAGQRGAKMRLVLLLLGFALLAAGCAAPRQVKAPDDGELTALTGTLLEARVDTRLVSASVNGVTEREERRIVKIELALESPQAVAGVRQKFEWVETVPLRYASLKGKKVRLWLPKSRLSPLATALPEGTWLEAAPES